MHSVHREEEEKHGIEVVESSRLLATEETALSLIGQPSPKTERGASQLDSFSPGDRGLDAISTKCQTFRPNIGNTHFCYRQKPLKQHAISQ
jgi:hypothetical protein